MAGETCFITMFLLNEESQGLIEKKRSTQDFVHTLEGCVTTDPPNPEGSLAFSGELCADTVWAAGAFDWRADSSRLVVRQGQIPELSGRCDRDKGLSPGLKRRFYNFQLASLLDRPSWVPISPSRVEGGPSMLPVAGADGCL